MHVYDNVSSFCLSTLLGWSCLFFIFTVRKLSLLFNCQWNFKKSHSSVMKLLLSSIFIGLTYVGYYEGRKTVSINS